MRGEAELARLAESEKRQEREDDDYHREDYRPSICSPRCGRFQHGSFSPSLSTCRKMFSVMRRGIYEDADAIAIPKRQMFEVFRSSLRRKEADRKREGA